MGISVGDRVRVTAPGTYNGLTGRVTARWWQVDMRDVQLDAGGEVPFRPDELEHLPNPDPNSLGHVWDDDEDGSYCKRCGGYYYRWYNGEVHGYGNEPIHQPCPGVEIPHGKDAGPEGYNEDCDCRNCG